MPSPVVDQLLQCMWPAPKARQLLDVYVLLDAARDEALYPAIQDCGLEFDCLFSGVLPPGLAKVAPYLVRLVRPSRFLTEILERSWTQSWGIFLVATGDRAAVRKHLQSLLLVCDAQGKELYFRYYDPRVLRVYLPTCNSSEIKLMFGPVRSYFAEAAEGRALMQYALRPASKPGDFSLDITTHPVA
jgi:hypothetical protein